VKTAFDYGDLEQVAERVMALVYEHAEELQWEPSWNKSRILTDAVQSVVFPE